MTLADEISKRQIVELLHFTTNNGIVGTLAQKALLSRHRLPEEKYLKHVLRINAATRPEENELFDKSQNWLDYVNLSISEINAHYFAVSKRWHPASNIWWGILAFDAQIMTHSDVVFATTNNAYDCCIRGGGLEGLEALFSPYIRRKKQGWSVTRGNRLPFLPTCQQAEVLYPAEVPTNYLRRIYVNAEDHHDWATGWLGDFGFSGVDVILSPEKFAGKPN
jgi:hypothetical protein